MADELPTGIEIEQIYVIEARYAPDAAETRPRYRLEHLTRIAALRDRGVVIEAGGHIDLSTALILCRAASEAEALALAEDDVYLRNGVWIEVRARPFGRVVRESELSRR
jgi:uncharacterized protein YciI